MQEYKVKVQSSTQNVEVTIVTDTEQNAISAALDHIDPTSSKLRSAGGKWLPINKGHYQLQMPAHVGRYIKLFRTGDVYRVTV